MTASDAIHTYHQKCMPALYIRYRSLVRMNGSTATGEVMVINNTYVSENQKHLVWCRYVTAQFDLIKLKLY